MQLRDIAIGKRLYISFSVFMFIVVLICLLGWKNMHDVDRGVKEIADVTFEKTIATAKAIDSLHSLYSSVAVIAFTTDNALVAKEIQNITEQRTIHATELGKIEKLETTKEGKTLIAKFKEDLAGASDASSRLLSLAQDGNLKEASALYLDETKPRSIRLIQTMKQLADFQRQSVSATFKNMSDANNRVRLALVVFGLVSVAGGLLIAFFLTRSIILPIREGVEVADRLSKGELNITTVNIEGKDEVAQLLKAMNRTVDQWKSVVGYMRSAVGSLSEGGRQLSASAEALSHGYEDQSGRISQVATAAEEMSQTVVDIAKNAGGIAASASETAQIANKGEIIVDKSVKEVKEIAQTVDASAAFVKTLGERSHQIGEIVTVINDIADQTNLLALNAAIEAARAGEQGRGFAVVADEVRKLAERTANATSEIGSMIGAIQEGVSQAVGSMESATRKVEAGVELSNSAGQSLRLIVQSVEQLQLMVQQIASATEEMSATSEQITRDIEQIASVSQNVAASSRQTTQASSEMVQLSETFQLLVGEFAL
ncbi:methyl-accepting chemotaxis protein [Syntrophorhabdus aromaticivorans]|uniref:HAMP domain-containing protein n=1 Tax=Syntrophorhabdus aromaticivorans TaxID=328301 RepID=A0A971S349_9BACT|nr:HAMP domain-containing methyl-accepting chemotaxis protein [Syntrophorhabdus aromaticivorans]NLW36932.1 HAMP domain-containing protein [Syntrophorhabdus aromaticivorans]